MANRDLFLNAVGARISDLCSPGRPAGPGIDRDAYDWFTTATCPQPGAVNKWVQGQLQPTFFGYIFPPTMGAWPNARNYVSALAAVINTFVNGPQPSGNALLAWVWLLDPAVREGTAVVPVEVLNWANANLPDICAAPLAAAALREVKATGVGARDAAGAAVG